MPTKDRQRALARAKLERQMARRAAAARRRRQTQAAIGAVIALVVVVVGAVFLVKQFAGDDSKKDTAAAKNPAACTYQPKAAAQGAKVKNVGLPPTTDIARTGTRTATLQTSRGPIEITLDTAKAPCSVNSFVHLAEKKFYDKSNCHRLVDKGIFVLQCGDPFGDGTGGPSYVMGTENLPTGLHPAYPAGTIAMAKGSDPVSVGSQFFIVYKDSDLPADYTVLGHVTKGLDVVTKVAAGGTDGAFDPQPGGGHPKQKISINTVALGPASSANPSASPTAGQ